jgi:uncharacterized protein
VIAGADFVVPATPYPVNDYANVLTRDEKEVIAKKLVQLKTETGVQLGILIVPTLNGSSIEEASIKVVESWKLGSKTSDDGALLMLAIAEHKSRLEIGRGLEGFLTDSNSNNILYNMRSALHRGNYALALGDAVDEITKDVHANKNDIMTKPTSDSESSGIFYWIFGIVGMVCLFIIYNYFREQRQEREEAALFQAKLQRRKDDDWARIMSEQGNIKHATTVDPTKLKKSPVVPIAPKYGDDSHISTMIATAAIIESESSSSDSFSSSSSSDYSSSSSDFSGGGGSFDGGGSSGSW